MFKNGVFLPLVYAKDENGVWRFQERMEEVDEDEDELEESRLKELSSCCCCCCCCCLCCCCCCWWYWCWCRCNRAVESSVSFLQNGICSFIGKTKCLDDPWNCICVCVYILCRCIYACRYLCLDLVHNIPLYLYHIYIFVKNVLCYICTSISISTVSQSLSIHPSTVSIYASINLSISMSMQMYIYIIIYTHTYIHACMHACMHAHLPTYVHTYTRTYVHTYNVVVKSPCLPTNQVVSQNIAPVPFCTSHLFNSLDVCGGVTGDPNGHGWSLLHGRLPIQEVEAAQPTHPTKAPGA